MNLTVSTEQKPTTDKQKGKPNITLHRVLCHKEIEQEKMKGTRKNYNQKTINKMAINS